MKNRVFLLAPAAAALVLTFAGCSKEAPKKPEGQAIGQGAQVLKVKTAKVEGRAVARSVEATGTLAPWDEVIVSNDTPGTVEKIAADLGDSVKSGATLAVLDQREARLNYEDAEAALQTSLKSLDRQRARSSDAKTTLARYDELFKEGMVSVSQHDSAITAHDVAEAELREAEAKVRQSEARLDLAKKRLSDTVIKSPISGEVKKRFVSVGENIKDKVQMFSIVSTGTLKFQGTVAETSVPKLKNGQTVEVAVDAYRDKTFKGRLTRISPAVDVRTRTLEVEASVPNPSGLLKPGFFAKGLVLTSVEKGVPFVPSEAVYVFVGITKVFVIEDGVAREKLVNTGLREGATVEVVDGIKPGQTVATTNLSALYDGVLVGVEGAATK
ncbi:MAG: efflux RND transporter periplasmic adaptor subunit [Deltaproteobacteria bacterium]|nr:efflux RND transporter periplasmic adaptor subunit [Deltaproteobacteria bacterium]